MEAVQVGRFQRRHEGGEGRQAIKEGSEGVAFEHEEEGTRMNKQSAQKCKSIAKELGEGKLDKRLYRAIKRVYNDTPHTKRESFATRNFR